MSDDSSPPFSFGLDADDSLPLGSPERQLAFDFVPIDPDSPVLIWSNLVLETYGKPSSPPPPHPTSPLPPLTTIDPTPEDIASPVRRYRRPCPPPIPIKPTPEDIARCITRYRRNRPPLIPIKPTSEDIAALAADAADVQPIRRGSFTALQRAVLEGWIAENGCHPTPVDYQDLMDASRLTMKQLRVYFTNYRCRHRNECLLRRQ
jgi:hypothetical protein